MEAIQTRKSIRGYKPDPIPKSLMERILDVAIRSPSSMNTQPWEITIVAEEALDNIRKGNVEMFTSGAVPNPDLPLPSYEGEYRQRQVGIGVQLFELMGIGREDKERRAEWAERGYRFFDAPAAIILSIDRSLAEGHALLGVGAILQSICLAALNVGLGTCISGQGVFFPEVVRRFTGIPGSKRIIMSIAIGYPDWDFAANKVVSKREPWERVTTWCGFD